MCIRDRAPAVRDLVRTLNPALPAPEVRSLADHVAGSIAERRQELAIRAAVGASPGRLIRLILRSAYAVTGLGLAVGLPAAVATGRGLASLLYGVRPYDPATLAAVAVAVVLTALAASTIPARRAARLDPMVVLRAE